MAGGDIFSFLSGERTVIDNELHGNRGFGYLLNGIACGFSGEQRVSPMEISEIPEMATIEPMEASLLLLYLDRQIHTVC